MRATKRADPRMRATNPSHVLPRAAANAATGAPPIDLVHLRRYTLGDRPLELEILGLFVDQLAITVGALKSAPSDKGWGMAAHTLKGSARAVGAWSLASLAERAESLGGRSPASERGQIVCRLEEAADEVRAYIASLGSDD
jgi:HPt (histidine-containing phosphotransfer) domain-containing protein